MTIGYPQPLPSAKPIRIRQGESLARVARITLTNPDGTPYNLVGWTSHATARLVSSSVSALFDATDVNGGVAMDAYNGLLWLAYDGEATALWTPGTYRFDWFAEDAGGVDILLWDATFTVIATETRVT
jgi:hypothetical protein